MASLLTNQLWYFYMRFVLCVAHEFIRNLYILKHLLKIWSSHLLVEATSPLSTARRNFFSSKDSCAISWCGLMTFSSSIMPWMLCLWKIFTTVWISISRKCYHWHSMLYKLLAASNVSLGWHLFLYFFGTDLVVQKFTIHHQMAQYSCREKTNRLKTVW